MTRFAARLAVPLVLSMLTPPALAFAGPQHPHESARPHEPARSPQSGGHHPAGRPQPDAPPSTLPGLTAAQVLSGPLPMSPAASTSQFSAAPSTYAPHHGISPFLRPRPSIVIDGFAFGPDTPSEPTTAADRGDTPTVDTPVAAQPPDAPPPDVHPPRPQPQDTAPSVAPNLGPVTLYVIPRCYAGDRPPADGMLPTGCDVSKLRTVRIK